MQTNFLISLNVCLEHGMYHIMNLCVTYLHALQSNISGLFSITFHNNPKESYERDAQAYNT